MRRTLFWFAFIANLVLSGAAAASCDDGEIVIKFSHGTNADSHPKGIAASLLAKRVNDEMDGKACMEVFPNSTLYPDNRVSEALLQGDVQLAAPHTSYLASYSQSITIFDFPFMFSCFAAVKAFQATDEAQAISSELARHGLATLELWHGGMTHISSNRPIQGPDDAAGLRLRGGYSDVAKEYLELLGVSPTQIPFGETGAALTTGAIDGLEASYTTLAGTFLPDALTHVTETNQGVITYSVVTSVDWLNSLPPDVKEQFLDILHDVTGEQNVETVRQNRAARHSLEEAGMSVHLLSDEERELWTQTSVSVWNEFADGELMAIVDVIQGINQTCHDGCCEECCEDDPDDCG